MLVLLPPPPLLHASPRSWAAPNGSSVVDPASATSVATAASISSSSLDVFDHVGCPPCPRPSSFSVSRWTLALLGQPSPPLSPTRPLHPRSPHRARSHTPSSAPPILSLARPPSLLNLSACPNRASRQHAATARHGKASLPSPNEITLEWRAPRLRASSCHSARRLAHWALLVPALVVLKSIPRACFFISRLNPPPFFRSLPVDLLVRLFPWFALCSSDPHLHLAPSSVVTCSTRPPPPRPTSAALTALLDGAASPSSWRATSRRLCFCGRCPLRHSGQDAIAQHGATPWSRGPPQLAVVACIQASR